MSPLLLLDEADPFRWAVWVATHNVVMKDEKEASDKMKSSGPRVAGRRR